LRGRIARILLIALLAISLTLAVAYCVETVTIAGHVIDFCNSAAETCTFKFFENPVNLTVAIYNTTLQYLYGTVTVTNVYGFNVSDSWFMDKMWLFNSTVLFNPSLAEKLGLYTIELTQVRKYISISIYIETAEQSQYQPPLYVVVFEVVNNTPTWGQLAIVQSAYGGQVQIQIDIPGFWYQTYGCVALYSNKTGALYKWLGVELLDYVTLSLGTTGGTTWSVTIHTVSGKVIKIPQPTVSLNIVPPPKAFMNIRVDTASGIILIGMILGVVAWGLKRDTNVFFAGAFACFLIGIIALIMRNITVGGIAVGVGIVLLIVRLIMTRLATWGY